MAICRSGAAWRRVRCDATAPAGRAAEPDHARQRPVLRMRRGEPGMYRVTLDWVTRFLRLESAGGLVLIAAALVALVMSNSPLAGAYRDLLSVPVEFRIGRLELGKPLHLWIDDGLMAVFFLLVGLEIKREVVKGELSTVSQVGLPMAA